MFAFLVVVHAYIPAFFVHMNYTFTRRWFRSTSNGCSLTHTAEGGSYHSLWKSLWPFRDTLVYPQYISVPCYLPADEKEDKEQFNTLLVLVKQVYGRFMYMIIPTILVEYFLASLSPVHPSILRRCKTILDTTVMHLCFTLHKLIIHTWWCYIRFAKSTTDITKLRERKSTKSNYMSLVSDLEERCLKVSYRTLEIGSLGHHLMEAVHCISNISCPSQGQKTSC